MTWDESKHPRKENGEFTFKNGGDTGTITGGAANILYKDEKIKREKDKKESEYKSKLLDILGDKANPADVLYAKPEQLEERAKRLGLETKLKEIKKFHTVKQNVIQRLQKKSAIKTRKELLARRATKIRL